MDKTSDAKEVQASGSWFRGFGNALQGLAQNLVDTSRAAFRPHLDDAEDIDQNEAPPAKRRRLTQDLSTVGDEDQGQSSTGNVYEPAIAAVAESDTQSSDTESVAVSVGTVKRKLFLDEKNDTHNYDEADTEWVVSVGTVKREMIEEEQNEIADVDEADTEPLNEQIEADTEPFIEQGEADTEPAEAAKKPKMYFDWLDDKTLVKIFDQLNLYDLLQMADEDPRIEQVIAEKIMPSRVLNIGEISKHYSVRHAFKHFGRFAPEVVMSLSDIQWKDDKLSEIEEIFRLIGKRCSDGNLKKLSITFDIKDKKSCEFRTDISECFKTLESLTIMHCKRQSAEFDHCLKSLLAGCTGMKSLTLNQIKSNGKFLSALEAIKIQELTIESCRLTESKFWLEMVQKGIPSLKSFNWNNFVIAGLDMLEEAFAHISTAFRNLEELCFDTAFVSMEKFITFAKLQHNPLKVLRLKCSWYDYDVPVALSQMPYLQELHIDIHDRWAHWSFRSRHYYQRRFSRNGEEKNAAWKNAMQCFTKLEIIKIQSTQYCFDWGTYIDFVANLPDVREVGFKGTRAFRQKHIEDIVSMSPQIHTLKLDVPIEASFTRKLYNTLVRDRSRWYRKSPALCIYMDAQKVSSLKKTVADYATKANCICLHSPSQM
ncbi:uncharacterized protein LOC129570414 [Sitodiplosis mosellana]|uniref:uncharacterized protein LOC129570414 n=1 Tax=Sitodiplosis mosellana TaxID=263140 RepID=UPI002443EBB3|nr:uncharacterized protein LOC129570414 [Sitodiplosis mosellana]